MQVTGNTPDTIYIELKQIIPGYNFPPEWTERQIFLVEHKPPTSEFSVELDDNTFSHQVWNEPSTRMYGAIAIGWKVDFYTFNGTTEPARECRSTVILNVETEHSLFQVESSMEGIKAHGWGWASLERMHP